ncbi:MAG TPA: serine/threonine-protein kinase [Jatrophihabitans sp.]|uniref:serine/threonine-protein kinase n=1 Tax=Jatrophihabitans sp. TaxID=1932789 RepID=UPI002DFED2B6|nr:serine/threonine-protein kinase [Jatrophihabitans sp.]
MSRPDVLIADRYRLVERIAAGGMGSVWEAWDERLHRRVALKQLHPQPGLSKADAALAGNRAMREARITARLHHAHAVPVYDVVDFEGQPCLIMQYLPSRSLQSLLTERGVLEVDEVARIGSQVASALAAAHQAGIVHRDVKPGNVLIDEDGSAKLTDFGISHALGDVSLTSTGMVTGTPAFLAPEVARGIESGFASDVFSLGSTLYAALEGTPPFGTGENPMATLHRVASGEIAPPQRSGPLTGELQRMLSVDPARRPTMQEAAARLAAISAGGAVGDTTERLAAPLPEGPSPSRTMTLPAARPERPAGPPVGPPPPVRRPVAPYAEPPRDKGPRRNRTAAAIGLVALLLVAGLVVLVISQLTGSDSGAGTAASNPPTRASRPAPATPAQRSTSRPPSSSSSAPTSSAPNSSSPAPTTSATKSKGNGRGSTRAQLAQAVTDYYGLLPGNTDAAWSRLTPSFQQSRAGGRQQYDQFWSGFSAVSTSNVSADAKANTVTAHVTYTRKDGSTTSETDTFGLVSQDGVWKIDSQN